MRQPVQVGAEPAGWRCAGRARGAPQRRQRRRAAATRAAGSSGCARACARPSSSIAQVFTGARIDDALYEELEVRAADGRRRRRPATEYLLADLKRRVKERKATEPAAVKGLLAEALADLLQPLERPLEIGRAGADRDHGGGRQRRRQDHQHRQADAPPGRRATRRCCWRRPTPSARRRASSWRCGPSRNRSEIVSQEGGDPAAVTFDAVVAGRARGCDVVIADTAGRLPTQTAPDGRAEEDPARDRQGRRPARRTRCCWWSTATPARTRWRRCKAFDEALRPDRA